MPQEYVVKMKSKDRKAIVGLLSAETLGVHQVMDIENYSSLGHVLHVTAYVLKFIERLKHPHSPTSLDLSQAENLWIQDAQTLLTSNDKFQSWKGQLSLFLDPKGAWRCGGRISNADPSD